MKTIGPLARRMGRELTETLSRVSPRSLEGLGSDLLHARRIVCHGVGREGLVMQAGCMRLMHAGLPAWFFGEMSTPPVGRGDVFLTSAGPGYFPTVDTLMRVARRAGARTVVVTAKPREAARLRPDRLIFLPAQTMADAAKGKSAIPMGGHYEAALLLFFDALVLSLLHRTGQPLEAMYGRYTNLK
jgi:6-phospho-3-hexuloisomerase